MPVGERPKPVSNLPPDLEIEKYGLMKAIIRLSQK
jgi:hypothetical protein